MYTKNFRINLDQNRINGIYFNQNKSMIIDGIDVAVKIGEKNILENMTVNQVENHSSLSLQYSPQPEESKIYVHVNYLFAAKCITIKVTVFNRTNEPIEPTIEVRNNLGSSIDSVLDLGRSQQPTANLIRTDNMKIYFTFPNGTRLSVNKEEGCQTLVDQGQTKIMPNQSATLEENILVKYKNTRLIERVLYLTLIFFLIGANLFQYYDSGSLFEQQIRSMYNGTIDEEYAMEQYYKGIVNGLNNQYSQYLTEEEYQAYMNQQKIFGFQYAKVSDGFQITYLQPGSPAFNSELCTGDIITELSGQKTSHLTSSEFAELASPDETQTFSVYRPATGKTLTVSLAAEEPSQEYVTSKLVDFNGKKYGYVKISEFGTGSGEQFYQKVKDLNTKGIDELVIDVCSNPGGSAEELIIMLSTLIDEKESVFVQRDKDDQIVLESLTDPSYYISPKFNVSVLQNSSSASASEALSLILKEYYGAEVIGVNSYGKGVGQTLVPAVGTGSTGGYVVIQAFTWESGKGTSINEVGVEPTKKMDFDYTVGEQPILTESLAQGSSGNTILIINQLLYYSGYGANLNSNTYDDHMAKLLEQFCKDNNIQYEGKITPEIAKKLAQKSIEKTSDPNANPYFKAATE